MTETLSIRIDSETKMRLDALSKRSKRSKSFLAAELDSGEVVSHEKLSKWLKSWGRVGETKAPR